MSESIIDSAYRLFGRIYELFGRDRCSNCGGPIGSYRTDLTLTEDDFETAATRARNDIQLCETCCNSYWLLTGRESGNKEMVTNALERMYR